MIQTGNNLFLDIIIQFFLFCYICIIIALFCFASFSFCCCLIQSFVTYCFIFCFLSSIKALYILNIKAFIETQLIMVYYIERIINIKYKREREKECDRYYLLPLPMPICNILAKNLFLYIDGSIHDIPYPSTHFMNTLRNRSHFFSQLYSCKISIIPMI